MSFLLVVFQGPSGSGKSTLQALLGIPRIVTWTSRSPRPGEIHGKDYHFAAKPQMEAMYNEQKMLEMTTYQDNYYGTSLDTIQEAIAERRLSSIVLDANGAGKLKRLLADKVLTVGVHAEFAECQARLLERGGDGADTERRLRTYAEEVAQLAQCDMIINNTDENKRKSESIIEFIKTGMVNGVHGI